MVDQGCIVPIIFLVIGALFGFLTLYAKDILRDKKKTQLFAIIAIMGTVGLVMWALIFL